MNQQYLLQTARQLNQPSVSSAAAFEASREGMAEELYRQMSTRADVEKLIGAGNLAMMQDNSRNICRFMSSMFNAYEPEVYVQTVLWVFRAYRSHGFATIFWPANLDTLIEIVRSHLTSDAYIEINPFFQWLIVNIPVFVKISDEQLAAPLSSEPAHDLRS